MGERTTEVVFEAKLYLLTPTFTDCFAEFVVREVEQMELDTVDPERLPGKHTKLQPVKKQSGNVERQNGEGNSVSQAPANVVQVDTLRLNEKRTTVTANNALPTALFLPTPVNQYSPTSYQPQIRQFVLKELQCEKRGSNGQNWVDFSQRDQLPQFRKLTILKIYNELVKLARRSKAVKVKTYDQTTRIKIAVLLEQEMYSLAASFKNYENPETFQARMQQAFYRSKKGQHFIGNDFRDVSSCVRTFSGLSRKRNSRSGSPLTSPSAPLRIASTTQRENASPTSGNQTDKKTENLVKQSSSLILGNKPASWQIEQMPTQIASTDNQSPRNGPKRMKRDQEEADKEDFKLVGKDIFGELAQAKNEEFNGMFSEQMTFSLSRKNSSESEDYVQKSYTKRLSEAIQKQFKKMWNYKVPGWGNKIYSPFSLHITPGNCIKLGVPNYFEVITTPMDLTVIKAKKEKRKYQHLSEFRDDVMLMLENALKFNIEGDNVYAAASLFKQEFQQLLMTNECQYLLQASTTRKRAGSIVLADDDEVDDGSMKECIICDEVGDLLICEDCPRCFHQNCLRLENAPEEEHWICPNCQIEASENVFSELDCHNTKELMKLLEFILDYLMKHNLSGPFREAVQLTNKERHIYMQAISKPMDLGTIQQAMKTRTHSNEVDIISDIRLVWRNCKSFNEQGSLLWRMANHLSNLFEKFYKNFLEVRLNENDKKRLTKLAKEQQQQAERT